MKILLLQDRLRSGGTERQTVLLANACAAAGHAVTLLTFRPGGALAPTVDPAVTRHALQPFDTGLDWFAPGLARFIARRPPDIILCMGRMANCHGRGLVRATHDRWPRLAVVGTMRTGKSLPRLFRISLHHVRHIIANSHAAKEALVREHGLPAGKVTVIHNALVFPAGPAAPRDERLRAAHGATPATRVLLNVAMFRPGKGQAGLIRLAAGLPADFPWQLWLAGDGPERRACTALARRLGLADRVKFFGFQSDPTALYAAADLAVHASRTESLSNFLVEAQAHGLPAVAGAAQGIGECFIPGDTGALVPRDRPDAFRAAVLAFAAPDEARRERARAFARENFDPGRQVQAHLDLFARLAQA
jgi:glycosyltransferase involved in cell wall biosynthesis